MRLDSIKAIANAVLYEGYILYPYRPSSIKNRQRWTFGGVFPTSFDQQGDASFMETQVLLRGGEQAVFGAHFRFLQVVKREIGLLAAPADELPKDGAPALTLVPRLDVDGRELLAWEEALEREVVLGPLRAADIQDAAFVTPLRFEPARSFEPVRDRNGRIVAVLVRTSLAIDGVVEAKARRLRA